MRDYARQPTKPARSHRTLILTLCALLLIGGIVYAITLLKKHRQTIPPKTPTITKKTKPAEKKKLAASQKPTKPSMTYDFYQLLPKISVDITRKKDQFVLQVAAVQSQADANTMQSTLKHEGYSAFIQPYQTNNHAQWFRVVIGPFQTLKAAQAQQDQLDNRHIEAMLLKQPPTRTHS